jgi:hypothetical protein
LEILTNQGEDGGGGWGAKKPSDDLKLRFNRSETQVKKSNPAAERVQHAWVSYYHSVANQRLN